MKPIVWPRLLRAVALAIPAIALACAPAMPAPPYLSIETAAGTRFVRVEIADTDAARERGLMGRASLDEDAGMLFIWAADTSSPFWMKDTLIPLTVAFIADGGGIVGMLDMEPCRADPCTIYDPRVTYRMALEVKQGALERRGVRVGDRARLVR